MIGRRTTKKLARAVAERFAEKERYGNDYEMPSAKVYDFLFEHGFAAAFCNAAESACHGGVREFEEFILKLHTGETVRGLKSNTPLEVAEVEGQVYIRKLAETLLNEFKAWSDPEPFARSIEAVRHGMRKPGIEALEGSLELDGFSFKDGRLLHRESAPVDSEKCWRRLPARWP